MKTLTILLALGSLNAFASETYTRCDLVNLQKDFSTVNVYLSKEGELQEGSMELSVTDEKTSNKVEIDGLQAKIVKATLLDSTTKKRWGFGGPSTTFSKVFGVKLNFTANESIGHQINGCIPQPVNEIETYAICYEQYTVINHP